MTSIVELFKRGRGKGVPLFGIATPDPPGTIAALTDAVNGETPIIQYDFVNGLSAINDWGAAALRKLQMQAGNNNPTQCLVKAKELPAKSILFFHNAPRFLPTGQGDDAPRVAVMQAMWNLRDLFKADQRSLVLLGQTIVLPPELSNDVIILDEPLPSSSQLAALVAKLYNAATTQAQVNNIVLPKLTDVMLSKSVDAMAGLPLFTAEQIFALSLTKNGILFDDLWSRKCQMIAQTQGLSVDRTQLTFANIGGLENLKRLGNILKTARDPYRGVVWIDEIEKAMSFGQAAGDGNVSKDQLGQLLTYMQERMATGMILIGPPGTAKSMFSKALACELGVLNIALDFGGMKGQYVGQSEAAIRNALKVIDAVTQSRAFFVATCNQIVALPPELRRRFKMGTFFLDLPSATERKTIWKLYLDKYSLKTDKKNPLPEDNDWSGAEIAACCENVWQYGISFEESASFIVPVAEQMGEDLKALRELAHDRFLNAAAPGKYRMPVRQGGRAMTIQ